MAELKITLYSPFTFENLIVSSQPFTGLASEIANDTDEAAILDSEYNNLLWEDFPNALMICNYYDNIDSSRLGTGAINGYTLQRKKNGDKYWDTIYQGTVGFGGDFIPNAVNYNVIDFNIQNNTKYNYRVVPNVASKSSFVINQEDGIDFITDWEVFTLTPITITQDPQNIEKGMAQPIMQEDGTPMIWVFVANVEEGSFTKNQDKTYFNTFVKYPKVNVGNTNYFAIPFTAYLGAIDENLQYYEPSNILEKWNNFINSNYICLYKNIKGDCRIVSIDPDSTNTYFNQVCLYSPNNTNYEYTPDFIDKDKFITNRPTTISINMTEVLDATKYNIAIVVPQS